MSRPSSMSSLAGAPVPPFSDSGKSPYQERAETFQRLEMTQKRKSQSETELQTLVRIRSTTPNMSPIEQNDADETIVGLRQQIGLMNHQIQDLVAKLEQQETVIAQQKTTILTQSRAIQNPRGTNNAQYVASSPLGHGTGAGHLLYDNPRTHGPPPPYNNSPYHGYPHENSKSQNWPAPTASTAFAAPTFFNQSDVAGNMSAYHHQPPPEADEFGSPHRHSHSTSSEHHPRPTEGNQALATFQDNVSRENDPFGPMRVLNGKFNAKAAPFLPPRRTALASAQPIQSEQVAAHMAESPLSNPYPETSARADETELTLEDTLGTEDAALAEQVDKVFAACRSFAMNHTNVPNIAGDTALPQDLKLRIIRAVSTQTAFPLMKNPQTRYWVVTKLLILHVLKHVLRLNTFAGLDRAADHAIDSLRQSIYPSTPVQLRSVMLRNIAEKTRQIVESPKYKGYVDHLIKQRAEKMFWDIRPLKHQATLRDQEDMILLVAEAHKLAEMMNTSAYEYAFNFADVGDRFDVFTMKNICPRYGGFSDDEMRARWATVRLCATPEVVIKKLCADSNQVQEVKLHRMRVLLKVRGDDRPGT